MSGSGALEQAPRTNVFAPLTCAFAGARDCGSHAADLSTHHRDAKAPSKGLDTLWRQVRDRRSDLDRQAREGTIPPETRKAQEQRLQREAEGLLQRLLAQGRQAIEAGTRMEPRVRKTRSVSSAARDRVARLLGADLSPAEVLDRAVSLRDATSSGRSWRRSSTATIRRRRRTCEPASSRNSRRWTTGARAGRCDPCWRSGRRRSGWRRRRRWRRGRSRGASRPKTCSPTRTRLGRGARGASLLHLRASPRRGHRARPPRRQGGPGRGEAVRHERDLDPAASDDAYGRGRRPPAGGVRRRSGRGAPRRDLGAGGSGGSRPRSSSVLANSPEVLGRSGTSRQERRANAQDGTIRQGRDPPSRSRGDS